MRLFIIRAGSGWGGIEGRRIIDTEEAVSIDIDKCIELTKDYGYYDNECIRYPLIKFPIDAISSYEKDLSVLVKALPTCEIYQDHDFCFDQQIDYLYILNNDEIKCVFNTDMRFWPSDQEILDRVIQLIDEVG